MPIFEYQCCQCGHEYEHLTMGANDQPACPQCGGSRSERQMSGFAVCSPGGGGISMDAASGGGGCGSGGFS